MQRGVAEVGGGEPGSAELVLGDHRHRTGATGERGEVLEGAGRHAAAGVVVASGAERPPEHVQDLVAVGQAVAEDPVVGGRPSGGDRGQCGGGGGRGHRGDGPVDALRRGQRRGQGGPGAQLRPAQSVDDQEHHLGGVAGRPGQPVLTVGAGGHAAEQARDDVGDAGGAVVG